MTAYFLFYAMNILTVHYNTPELMDCMIRSLNKHTSCTIHVFDNSDEEPFVNTYPNVEVIDNTKGQIINFDRWLTKFPERMTSVRSNFASAKHCKSVDACFDLLPDGFILMDSDVLVKQDISVFWDERKAWVGQPLLEDHRGTKVTRLLPFMCYLNVPLLREHGVRYFKGEWMWHMWPKEPNRWYDTGAWLYKDCMEKNLPHEILNIDPYIEHFAHGSHVFMNESLGDWLNKHRDLWK